MSYLDLPRICFGGAWTGNVATANNQPYLYWETPSPAPAGDVKIDNALLFDFANVSLNDITVDGEKPSDAMLRQLLNDEANIDGGDANWCYWGMNSGGIDTKVTSVNLGAGYKTKDPLVGKVATFINGELCDCNPAGSQSTQMFFNGFDFAGVTLEAPRTFSRWVWFYRNTDLGGSAGASGAFEAVLPITDEQWAQLRAIGSPAIEKLYAAYKAAGAAAAGLSVRYGLYASTSVAAGATTDRVGMVSGAIGVGTKDELQSYPNCRTLYSVDAVATGGRSPKSRGPVLMKINPGRSRVAIDLFNALKETGTTLQTISKVNIGPLVLGWTKPSIGACFTFAPIPYSQYNMNNTKNQGSVIDVDFSAYRDEVIKLLNDGWVFYLGTTGIADSATAPAIPKMFDEGLSFASDQRDYYLDNGEAGSVRIKAMGPSGPIANATVWLQQFIVNYATGAADVGGLPVVDSSAWAVTMPDTVTTDAEGYADVPLKALKNGNCVIRFTIAPNSMPVNVLTDSFINIRVLPTDDYSKVSDADLLGQTGFQFMYQNVLRYYYITYPVMQPIMDFSDYNVMTSPRMLQMLPTVTDHANWGQAGYMPRTRELSKSRQALLARWAKVNYDHLYGGAKTSG